jgi:hypothetical protein
VPGNVPLAARAVNAAAGTHIAVTWTDSWHAGRYAARRMHPVREGLHSVPAWIPKHGTPVGLLGPGSIATAWASTGGFGRVTRMA